MRTSRLHKLLALAGLAAAGGSGALSSPCSAAAQQPVATLEEVVVTATRSAEEHKRVPARVEVVEAADIELTTGATLTEQLKKHNSVNVIEYPGALAGIGIRGFRPEFSGITKHSLVLVNGRPAGATNLATILTPDIERIEVLKGPASSLYGAEAMGGVVNVITRKSAGPLAGEVEAGFGSFGGNQQRATIGGDLTDRFDFDLTALRFEQADDYDMGNGQTRPHTSYEIRNGSLRLAGRLAGGWRAEWRGDLYQGRGIETPGDIAYGSSMTGSKDIDRYGIDLRIAAPKMAGHTPAFTVYRAQELAEYTKNYTGWWPAVAQVTPYRSFDSENNWVGAQITDAYTLGPHKIIAGIDYQYIVKESRSYNPNGSRKAPWSPDESRTNWAGYLETVWSLLDGRLTATAGGRYDRFEVETRPTPYFTLSNPTFVPKSETFATFSPRAGLAYLLGNGVRLHATVGRAFVPPSAAQLAGFWVNAWGNTTKGNPNLDPETSITWDAGIGLDRPELGLSLDLTWFATTVDDKITTVVSGAVKTFQNSLGAEMQGVEYSASLDLGAPLGWEQELTLFVNGTSMVKAEEEKTAGVWSDIHNVAKYTVNYGVRYDDGRFDGKLNFRTVGWMKDTDWTAAGWPEITYPSFTVADLVVGWNMGERHRFVLAADNLFNRDYYEKKGYPKPGRSFFLSYRYTY